MPFDHAKCPNPSCGAVLDPERLKAGPQGPVCPRCNTTLGMEDIFGVAAAFSEEDQEHLTLDDLVPDGSRGAHGGYHHDPEPHHEPEARAPKKKLTLDKLLPGPAPKKLR